MERQPTRRQLLISTAAPILQTAIFSPLAGGATAIDLSSAAGVDRVAILPGKTYLRGWVGYGDPPPGPGVHRTASPPSSSSTAQVATGPPVTTAWTKESGPGEVRFADSTALITTATFTRPGNYVLRLTAHNSHGASFSSLRVAVETAPPVKQLEAVYTRNFKVHSKFWDARIKSLVVEWIPHCIDVINRNDVTLGTGGIDNFIEAGKRLRGEPAGTHKGYVFSNAWVHQTVEAMSIALMVDPRGDAAIQHAHEKFRLTLADWIPKILAAQESDGYLQTAFTLDRANRRTGVIERSSAYRHWDPAHRGDHEGYVAGYFLESAINHYLMTGKQDARLYNAAKRLADCWHINLGPAPKRAWYDGHQQMEQALVRFGRFVNDMEGGGRGDKYIQTARFLLDSRYRAAVDAVRDRQEYDQSHLPVTEQYEAVGHAVRAAYTYSGMADVAVETHDPDYQSAVRSLWDNIVNKKYYVTGGIGSGETDEGFGPNYSLGQDAYCESCSSCGMIFFHWKMNLAYHNARYIDNLEETFYNALLGSVDLAGRNFFYTNPLDGNVRRCSWHTCPCCVGNIPRTLLMVPTWTYAKSPEGVYVNLYIGSSVFLENAAGTDIEMVQDTDYPWSGKISVTVNPRESKRFAVRLRVPNRATSKLYSAAPEVNGILSLAVNGKALKPVVERGYAVLERQWRAGDRIELELPMPVQRVSAIGQIVPARGKVALRRGPLMYNVERIDQNLSTALASDTKLEFQWRADLLGGVVVINGVHPGGAPLLAIPNYARLNRNPELLVEGGPIAGDPQLYSGPTARLPTVKEMEAAQENGPPPVVSQVWMPRG